MKSAERILASDDVEEKGLCLAFLQERYTKAALLAYSLGYSVAPYLRRALLRVARWYWNAEGWSKKAVAMTPTMVRIAVAELECGGTSAEERARAAGVSRATWYRHYSKHYEALYSDLV